MNFDPSPLKTAFIRNLLLGLTLALSSSAQTAKAETIRVLTYNTWGVPLTAWDTWRYEKAMRAIEALKPDVVLLNEVFTRKGKRHFKSFQFPFQAFGPKSSPRLVGSGLKILSKFPILNQATLAYRACKGTDCLSKKGAALAILQLPSGKKLNLVGTHLDASDAAHVRISQLKQLENFQRTYADPSAPLILAGDLNFRSGSDEHEHVQKNFGLEDAWLKTHSSNEPGYTYDCYENHYARDYAIRTREPMIRERLDYFFTHSSIQTLRTEIQLDDEENLFSDHYALMGEFEI
jgi:endonuclease/exonuclease/phosphatase family metal-dependent hydrolase